MDNFRLFLGKRMLYISSSVVLTTFRLRKRVSEREKCTGKLISYIFCCVNKYTNFIFTINFLQSYKRINSILA